MIHRDDPRDGPENSPVLLRCLTAQTHKLQNYESSRSAPGPKGPTVEELKLQVPACLNHQILLNKETRTLWTVLVACVRQIRNPPINQQATC